MEFNYIINPESGKRVSIYGTTGKKVLGNYVKYLQKIGGQIKKSKKNKKNRKKRKSKQKKKKMIKNKKNGGADLPLPPPPPLIHSNDYDHPPSIIYRDDSGFIFGIKNNTPFYSLNFDKWFPLYRGNKSIVNKVVEAGRFNLSNIPFRPRGVTHTSVLSKRNA